MGFFRQYNTITPSIRFTSYATDTKVLSEPAPSPVTSEEAYRFVPIHDKVSDKLVVRLIEGATQKVENYIKRDVTPKLREALFVYPKNRIFLPFGIHGDVLELVEINSEGKETPLQEHEYVIEGLETKSIVLKRNMYSVRVTYESGYKDCPDAIVGAILHEYSLLYKNRNDPNQAPRQIINGLSVEARLLLVDGGFVNYG